MKVIIGCERSGVVRRAFRQLGHEAYSCDLAPAEDSQKHHLLGDVFDYIANGWDLGIFHPPCTHLAVSGARWFNDPKFPDKPRQQREAIAFVKRLWNCPIPHLCLENPKGVLSTQWRKPDQIIDPLNFGHAQTKETHLWLRNLPKLKTPDLLKVPVLENINIHQTSYGHHLPPGEQRAIERARTFPNIAYAMATQWGVL